MKADDFVGADKTRKYEWSGLVQYTNHQGGRKYDQQTGELLPRIADAEKVQSAEMFYEEYVKSREHASRRSCY